MNAKEYKIKLYLENHVEYYRIVNSFSLLVSVLGLSCCSPRVPSHFAQRQVQRASHHLRVHHQRQASAGQGTDLPIVKLSLSPIYICFAKLFDCELLVQFLMILSVSLSSAGST